MTRQEEFDSATWTTPHPTNTATQLALPVDHPVFRGANAYPEYAPEWVHKETGERRPITHAYRAMHKDEWAQAQAQGYIRSDERDNLFPGHEGTNAAPRRAVADGYLRHSRDLKENGVLAQIEIHPDDNWFASTDGNLRTRSRIPIHRVANVHQFGELADHD